MTQEETIRYLCRIKALVWRSIDASGDTASDCVCADQTLPKDLIRDDGMALDWMLNAVVLRLQQECRAIPPDVLRVLSALAAGDAPLSAITCPMCRDEVRGRDVRTT